jgi:GT2 family glycosyltransferase
LSTDPSIELSVVMAARDAEATIGEQIRALLGDPWPGDWEIVVADNGSSDGTRAAVEAAAGGNARVRIVDASEVQGESHARNVGVGAARGTSLAFCDADDVVGRGWVTAMAEALREHPFVTGPQEYETLNPTWLHGAFGTRMARELQLFEGIFPFGPTANLGVRHELMDAVGAFDTGLVVGMDVDLCRRLWLAGAHLTFVESAVVHYRYRATMGSLWRRARVYGTVAPEIGRRLVEAGGPTPSRWRGARSWVWLVRHLPTLRTRQGRARWVVVAGRSVGRISGSVRSRWVLL